MIGLVVYDYIFQSMQKVERSLWVLLRACLSIGVDRISRQLVSSQDVSLALFNSDVIAEIVSLDNVGAKYEKLLLGLELRLFISSSFACV